MDGVVDDVLAFRLPEPKKYIAGTNINPITVTIATTI